MCVRCDQSAVQTTCLLSRLICAVDVKLFSFLPLLFPFSAQINITAKSGENAILPCQDPGNYFTAVKWRRPDQEDEYIFLERDGHIVEYDQHPSFKNRTVLQDQEKKDGNVSLILKNVTTNDAGPIECLVFINESYKSIKIIYVHVDPPGE